MSLANRTKLSSIMPDVAARCLRTARSIVAGMRSEESGKDKLMTLLDDDVLNLIDPLFDEVWYRNRYPTAVRAGENPRFRYMADPAARNHAPHPLFDGAWYLAQHPEVAAAGLHPLLHYMQTGAALGYTPHPLFDGKRYLEQHPELAEAGTNPLLHYISEGAALGYSPCTAFDSKWYLYNNPDVAAEGMNPLLHFVRFGFDEGRFPHPFDEVAAFQTVARSEDLLKAIRLLDWRQHLLPQDGTVPYVATFAWGSVSELASQEPSAAAAPPMPSLDGGEVLRLKNAVVIGGTTSIIVAGRFVSAEAQSGQVNEGPFPCYGDAWRVGETAIVRFKRKTPAYITQGIHLTGNEEGTFINFLTSILPRLLLIESCGIDQTVPLLVSELAGERQMAALKYLNTSDRPIISLEKWAAYATDLLYYPVRSNVGIADAERRLADQIEGLVTVRERILASVKEAVPGRLRRLYIRPADPSRRLSQDDDFCEVLINRDFEIITTEILPFHVLVRLIAGASLIILHAAHEFVHALWCRPGCQIVDIDDSEQDDLSNALIRRVISRSATIHTFRTTFKRSGNDERPRPYVDLPTVMDALDEAVAAAGQPRTHPASHTFVAAN